jgi:D-3-phosphoglycerate dehydrogenase
MKICVIDPISEKAMELLRRQAEVVDRAHPAFAAWPDLADAVITRTSPLPAETIRRARHLKVIGKHGVGVDNIDITAAAARGIVVVNTPGANADAVAELTLGLALAAARHVVMLDRRLRDGNVPKRLPVGRELAGCRLGVAGFGQVGRRVSELFRRALGCAVTAFDPGVTADVMRAADIMPAPSLDALLAENDIVSLHLPLTAATHHAIGSRQLAAMPPRSILINVARGGIVDEDALADALRLGRPGAAASDVFADEPPPPDHPLLRLDNFIATPHVGAATEEALDRVGLLVAEQVIDVLAGRAPRHPVA